jgi:hypothetical protein
MSPRAAATRGARSSNPLACSRARIGVATLRRSRTRRN